MKNNLMSITFTFSFILLFFSNVYTQIPTYSIYPYTEKVFPEEPLVYYPTTGITFAAGNVNIKNLEGKIPDTNEVKLIQTKTFYNSTYTKERNRGGGTPASCIAQILFKKPGNTYTVTLSPGVGCSNCTNMDGSYPGDRKMFGNNVFKVQVLYPKLLITPKLKEKYIFNDKNVGFNLFCKGLEDENLYTHTIEIKNGNEPTSATVKKMEGIRGSEVSLDLLLAELDNNNKYFRIVGYYNGKEIPLSANKVAEFWTKMEINFDEYKVESTWKQGTKENAPELDLTDEKNLTFDFYYELEGGQKIGLFEPVESDAGQPMFRINGDVRNYIPDDRVKPNKTEYRIKLFSTTFSNLDSGAEIKIDFDFVDKATKKIINKTLYCKKK